MRGAVVEEDALVEERKEEKTGGKDGRRLADSAAKAAHRGWLNRACSTSGFDASHAYTAGTLGNSTMEG
jgi:hypothetical protein